MAPGRLSPAAVAALCWLALVLTPLRSLLESTLPGHVLVQLPLLIVLGYWLGRTCSEWIEPWQRSWNGGGIAGVLSASFTIAFWMLPRWLDASISEPGIAVAKYLSLPLLAGLPLALSWPRLHQIARAVVKIELIAMLARLGWLYLISPDRLCNNYLLAGQIMLGQAFLLLAVVLSLFWLAPVFFGRYSRTAG